MSIESKLIGLGYVGLMALTVACGPTDSEKQQAVRLAQKIYEQKKAEGVSFTNGPCLSDNLMPNWVADVAHNPRQPVDELKQNQCPSFGRNAYHFVELDPNGKVIRVY